MADPICRWRNPYFPTVRELISVLPTENLPKDIGRQLTNESFGSEDFFRTPYQLAAQLGLYYEDDLIFYTKFHDKPHPSEIDSYTDSWFRRYYVPNPYTVRGFANIQPKILYVELCKLLYDAQAPIQWSQVKDSLFGEEIGNDDILVNVINTYSRLFQVKNRSLLLKDGMMYEDLKSSIKSYTLPERNDKKGFFDHFPTESSDNVINLPSEVFDEKILFQDSNLRQIIFDTFKYVYSNYDHFMILEGHGEKNATIENRQYVGITLPQFFGFEIIFGQFQSEPSPEDLKSSNTRRFFLEKFNIRGNENTFLNNQWYETGDRGLNLHNLNKYLGQVSDWKLEIIKIDERYRLIKKDIAGKNVIYYGAPGTGKSYIVDQKIKNLDPTYFERVTFHPEYDNASFIGGYKPVSIKTADGKDGISYRFVPQAFSSIYNRAWTDPDHPYYLVIEEINRGNCAEIFGEIFQLLDRNSGYTVTPSKELHEYLRTEFADTAEHPGIAKGLKLPLNLSILATMNTSDQSLFPMDSAFKRRWEWEYVPICYDRTNEDGELNPSYDFEIDIEDGKKYRWIDFISKINNNHIKNNPSLGMDKCIGNYFIKPDSGSRITLKPFVNKVIFYLWNDVFKDEDNKVFESNGSYEDFFPVASAGTVKIKELFERIELSPIAGYREKEEEEELGRVAEENHTLGL